MSKIEDAFVAFFVGAILFIMIVSGCEHLRNIPGSSTLAPLVRSVICGVAKGQISNASNELPEEFRGIAVETAGDLCDAGFAAVWKVSDLKETPYCVLLDPEDLDGTNYQIVCFESLSAAVCSARGC